MPSSTLAWLTFERRQQIAIVASPRVFLPRGSAKPAYASLLLLMAGDVESNPGPGQCHSCTLTIGIGRPFFSCSLCDNLCHKQQKCSGKSRYNNSDSWTCNAHSRAPAPIAPAPSPAQKGDVCDACYSHLRAGAPTLRCPVEGCTATCHKKQSCSNLSRHSRETWRCRTHQPDNRSLVTIAGRIASELKQSEYRPPTSSAKCSSCLKTIAKNIKPLACHSCSNQYHKACMIRQGHSREQVDLLCSLMEWQCDKCAPTPPNPPHPPLAPLMPKSPSESIMLKRTTC